MWSGGQVTTPPATTPPAGGSAPAIREDMVEAAVKQAIHVIEMTGDLAGAIAEINSFQLTPEEKQIAFEAIRSQLPEGVRSEFDAIIDGNTGAATGTSPTPRRRGRGGRSSAAPAAAPGTQAAGGQQQGDAMAEHRAEEAADRKYSINEQIDGIEAQIAELRAKLTETSKNHGAEARQIAAEREKIASSIQQLEYSKQKLIDLQNRIAGKQDECDSLFTRYANDIANWTWLSKNDICAEVQKNWAECIFMMIKAMNDMARAITGNGGQGILPSAPSSRAMAPAMPTDGLLQQEKGSLNDLQGAEKEQEIAINAQDAQNGSALGQIDREEANRQHQYELSRQSLQEQVHRSEERLADLNQKLANVGINAAAGAAAAGGVSS